MDGLLWKTLLKWMIWGYHYFRKPPYTIWIIQKKKRKKWSIRSDSSFKGKPSQKTPLWLDAGHMSIFRSLQWHHMLSVYPGTVSTLAVPGFIFFSIWILQRLSLSFWSYIFPPPHLQPIHFLLASRPRAFEDFQVLRQPPAFDVNQSFPVFHGNLRDSPASPPHPRSYYHQLHQGMSWPTIIHPYIHFRPEIYMS